MTDSMNEAQLTVLYKESFPHVARLVKRLGGNLEETKDLFHDALLIYLEKQRKGTLQISVSATAYLVGIAKILWLQKQRKTLPIDSLQETKHDVEITEEWQPDESEQTTLKWLQMAGEKCLHLLKAFYYDGASMKEVAEQTGLKDSRSAIVQKYKCLEKIRNVVKKEALYEARIS